MRIHVPILRDPNSIRKVPIKRGAATIVIILLFLCLLTLFAYGVYKINIVDNLAEVQASKSLSENSNNYLAKISEKMWLPVDSKQPRILQITDPNLLSEKQSFYKGAIAGDILVVFDESKKAILYSPERDIIINSGPIVYRSNNEN